MPQTVEVRFKGTRRDFFTWPDDLAPLRLREVVVVPADRGQDLGRVQSAGESAEKKCGSCASCAVGEAVADGRSGGRAVAAGDPEVAPPVGTDEAPSPDAPPEAATAPAGDPVPAAGPHPKGATPRLRTILRRATQADIRQADELRKSEEDLRRQVTEKVRQHKLDMKVSDTEWQWDRAKLTIYFTAEKRVDFRALVRELAAAFRTRIELRQIGVRDEAARLGGVGRCGREYCCSTWLKELNPVSLALAKDQHLSLNPAQISGGCGRLLCCLKYEHEFYVAARKRFPREGKTLQTLHGAEKVVAVDIFRERVFLRSEAHGPRIIPLVQLREEQAEREAGGEAVELPTPTGTRPAAERREPGGEPRRAGSRAPATPPATTPPREDRRGRQPERRREPDRRAPEAERPPGDQPPRAPTARPAPPAEPPPGPRADASGTAAPTGGEGGRKRRRRGRRGRGSGGPGTPPPAPEA